MNLLELRSTLAAYLQKTVPDLTVNGVDLTLLALNNTRRKAEMMHDFEFSRKRVTVRVNGLDGGTLDDVTQEGSPVCEVKTVIECGVYDDRWNIHPVEWTTVAESLERQRAMKPGFGPRYPTDGEATTMGNNGCFGLPRIALCGNDIWCVPTGAQEDDFDLELEVYTFSPDWTNTTDSVVVSDVLGMDFVNGPYWQYGSYNSRPLYLNVADGGIAPGTPGSGNVRSIWYRPGEWLICRAEFTGQTPPTGNYQNMLATTMTPGGQYHGHGTWAGLGTVTMAPGSSTTDIWLKQGSQYLLWGAVVEVNHLCKEFVFRQEGNLPPPEKMRDEALETFRQWDLFKYEQDRRHVY
jgi:hypothetical protein